MSGVSPKSFELVKEPEDDFLCAICRELMERPYQVICCGSIYCKGCLEAWRKSCPNCRKTLDMQNTFPDKRMERLIFSLEVLCTNKEKGCKWRGALSDGVRHVEVCDFIFIECVLGCGKAFSKFDESEHFQKCPKRRITCLHCAKSLIAEKMEKHHQQCESFPMNCPNHCQKTFPRSELSKHSDSCPKALIPCTFHEYGCESKVIRADLSQHLELSSAFHLDLLSVKLKQLKEESPVFSWPVNLKFKGFLESETFYANIYAKNIGYCFRLKFEREPGQEYSLYFTLQPGKYDDILDWPFTATIQVSVRNLAKDGDHIKKTLTVSKQFTPKKPIAFEKPRTEQRNWWGLKSFVSDDILTSKYKKNDSILICIDEVTAFVQNNNWQYMGWIS